MEVRLVDIRISPSSGRHSTRAIVLKLLVRCLLASGILPLVENAEGIFHDAHSRNDQAGYSSRAAPEYAFGMESDFRRLGALSRQQSAGMLCHGRRQQRRRNSGYDLLRESICMDWYGFGGSGASETRNWNSTPEQNNRASRSLTHFHNQARCYSTRKAALRKTGIHQRI